MTFEDELRDTLIAERPDTEIPDLSPFRDAARRRQTRRHRVIACAGIAVGALLVGTLAYEQADRDAMEVITTPIERRGPAPAPNVQAVGGSSNVSSVTRPWLAARTGITDRQLILSFDPIRPGDCPIVANAQVVTHPDRVEIALLLADNETLPGASVCNVIGPPHVAVYLPEPLDGRALYDLYDPGTERAVLDGSELQVPTSLPNDLPLVEERILSNPQSQAAWSQTYGGPGSGSLIIAQSATHGRALAGAGLAAAAPGDAPVTLEATEPIRSGVLRQLRGDDVIEMTTTVYRELPGGRVTDAAMVWQLDGRSYTVRYRGTTGVSIDALVDVVVGMRPA